MSIAPINSTPLKPASAGNQRMASFKGHNEEDIFGYEDYRKVEEAANKANDTLIHSSSLKSPVQAAASVGLAVVVAYAAAKGIGGKLSTKFPNLPNKMSEIVDITVKKLESATDSLTKEESVGFKGKAKKAISFVTDKTSKFTKATYEKLQNYGLDSEALKSATEDVVASAKQKNAFNNAVAIAGTASVIPTVLEKDVDKDGAPDVLQKTTDKTNGVYRNLEAARQLVSAVSDLSI